MCRGFAPDQEAPTLQKKLRLHNLSQGRYSGQNHMRLTTNDNYDTGWFNWIYPLPQDLRNWSFEAGWHIKQQFNGVDYDDRDRYGALMEKV